jgi:hypothetical protein
VAPTGTMSPGPTAVESVRACASERLGSAEAEATYSARVRSERAEDDARRFDAKSMTGCWRRCVDRRDMRAEAQRVNAEPAYLLH